MMKKIAKKMVVLLMLAALLISCSTERRALGQMRTLTHNIETRGQYYDNDDWRDAYAQYKRIDDKMDVKKLNDEQQKEYGELQARCITSFAKCKVESVVDSLRSYINQGAGFLKGLMDAFGIGRED